MRFRKWMRYAYGVSYQHYAQPEGVYFEPGKLEGYFNDLRAKAHFSGVMQNGVPVVSTDTTKEFFFPIVIFQWGLGNWDLWLESNRTDNLRLQNVLFAADWAARNISESGGWECWTGLQRPVTSNFSAMAQGEASSLLVRAHLIAPQRGYQRIARQAIAFMLGSGPQALVRDWGSWQSLEEYPGDGFPAVLNGWCFALMGIEDLRVSTLDPAVGLLVDSFAASLARALPQFDCGYWSRYSIGRSIASPFYHDLHIAQLRVLSRVFPKHSDEFLQTVRKFELYRSSLFCRTRAVAVKVRQKLSQVDLGEME